MSDGAAIVIANAMKYCARVLLLAAIATRSGTSDYWMDKLKHLEA